VRVGERAPHCKARRADEFCGVPACREKWPLVRGQAVIDSHQGFGRQLLCEVCALMTS
jgi:hypothetical protein